jgi:hypothetical protein
MCWQRVKVLGDNRGRLHNLLNVLLLLLLHCCLLDLLLHGGCKPARPRSSSRLHSEDHRGCVPTVDAAHLVCWAALDDDGAAFELL